MCYFVLSLRILFICITSILLSVNFDKNISLLLNILNMDLDCQKHQWKTFAKGFTYLRYLLLGHPQRGGLYRSACHSDVDDVDSMDDVDSVDDVDVVIV